MSARAEVSAGAALSSRRIRVIWNANAGQKGAISTNDTDEQTLRDLMARHGLGDELHPTTTPDEARDLVRSAITDAYDVVAAAGGDGTIGMAATELLNSRVALGILPLGSVMNIPRMLGVPRELEAAAEILSTGVVRAIDVGTANETPFYEAASVGMNAAMFREAQLFEEGDYGSPLRVLWVALRYRPARMRLELDDQRVHSRALMVTISNGPYTGVGMTVAPDAVLDDGRFDVRVFRHYSKFELLRHLGSIAFGRRGYSPHVDTYLARSVRVESAHPLPCRADSNDLGTTPLECRVLAGALRVVLAPDSPVSPDSAVSSGSDAPGNETAGGSTAGGGLSLGVSATG